MTSADQDPGHAPERASTAADTLEVLRGIAGNGSIARAVVAFGGFTIGEWGIWTAMLVYAYERGGAAAAGLVALIQLAPSALLAPFLAGAGDHYRRERVLLVGYLAQAIAMAVTAMALIADAPVPVVYALAAITTLGITITRPVHGSLLPSLAGTPDELTAANVGTGTVQNVGILVAPALAGLLLAVAGPWAVFATTAAIQVVGAALVAGIRVETSTLDLRGASSAVWTDGDGMGGGPVGPIPAVGWIDGLREVIRQPGTRAVILLLATGSVIEGALDIVAVVLALDLLALGQGGVGLIGSAVGVGGLVGAAGAAALVGRARLAAPFALGLLAWGLPLVIVGVAPNVLVAVAIFFAAGIGRSVMDVAGRTLLQRIAPDDAIGGVFGALEGLHDAMLAVGSVGVPALIAVAGSRGGLVLAGAWLPIAVAVLIRDVRGADRRAIVHVDELNLLRSRPVFAPLAPPTIEQLSRHLVPIELAADRQVFAQGDRGDRFYLIEEGSVSVDIDGRFVRRLGPGDDFGEIALVRDVPRTASVRTLTPVRLRALDRHVFLAAITGHPVSRSLVEDQVSAHVGDPVAID